jgi:hypothetical protein
MEEKSQPNQQYAYQAPPAYEQSFNPQQVPPYNAPPNTTQVVTGEKLLFLTKISI